jgi:hypothetical protein
MDGFALASKGAARQGGLASDSGQSSQPVVAYDVGSAPRRRSARPGEAPVTLAGRQSERDVLDRLIEAVRAGESRALVVRGEPGVGKTALLDYLAGRAAGCRVARTAGVQSEMELAFAGLHQLVAPVRDHLANLPEPQREALQTAFGFTAGPAREATRTARMWGVQIIHVCAVF